MSADVLACGHPTACAAWSQSGPEACSRCVEVARLTAELAALRDAVAPGADARTDCVAIAEISRRQAAAQEQSAFALAELRAELAAARDALDCGLTDAERAAWTWESGPECRKAEREIAARQDRPAPLRVGEDCARCDAESAARTLASTRARLAEAEAECVALRKELGVVPRSP